MMISTRLTSEEKVAQKNVTLFFAKDPEKFSIHLNRTAIISLLNQAALKYEIECMDKKPGEEGLKRRDEFYLILAKFIRQDILLFSFQELARFYKKHGSNSRLMRLVEEVLLKSLGIEQSSTQNDFFFKKNKLDNAIQYYSGSEFEMEEVISIHENEEKPTIKC